MSSVNTEKTRRMVGLSILTALVIVLQFVAEYIKVGATPITLTLVPIVVGSALYGVRGGAWLGGVFGVVVWLMSIANIDPTGALLWNLNPFLTTVICIGKGALAGLAAAGAEIERYSRTRDALSERASELRRENAGLEELLREGRADRASVIEGLARERLGLVYPDEIDSQQYHTGG